MASSKTMLALATILLLATTQAHGLAVGGVAINTCIVAVGLHCQANPAGLVTGNAAPLTDITVDLLLNNQLIGSARTDLDGTSRIIVNSEQTLTSLLSLSNLKARVSLPIARCSIWANTNGVLEGPVEILNVVGGVLNLVVHVLHVVA